MKRYFFAIIPFFSLAACVSSDNYEQQYHKNKREEYHMGVGVVQTESQRRAIMSGEKPDWTELPEPPVYKQN